MGRYVTLHGGEEESDLPQWYARHSRIDDAISQCFSGEELREARRFCDLSLVHERTGRRPLFDDRYTVEYAGRVVYDYCERGEYDCTVLEIKRDDPGEWEEDMAALELAVSMMDDTYWKYRALWPRIWAREHRGWLERLGRKWYSVSMRDDPFGAREELYDEAPF